MTKSFKCSMMLILQLAIVPCAATDETCSGASCPDPEVQGNLQLLQMGLSMHTIKGATDWGDDWDKEETPDVTNNDTVLADIGAHDSATEEKQAADSVDMQELQDMAEDNQNHSTGQLTVFGDANSKAMTKVEAKVMEDYGQGYCTNDYLRGWDGKGTGSQAACNAVCMAEPDCTYAAWKAGKTCSRYYGTTCTLNGVGDHYTYAKREAATAPECQSGCAIHAATRIGWPDGGLARVLTTEQQCWQACVDHADCVQWDWQTQTHWCHLRSDSTGGCTTEHGTDYRSGSKGCTQAPTEPPTAPPPVTDAPPSTTQAGGSPAGWNGDGDPAGLNGNGEISGHGGGHGGDGEAPSPAGLNGNGEINLLQDPNSEDLQ